MASVDADSTTTSTASATSAPTSSDATTAPDQTTETPAVSTTEPETQDIEGCEGLPAGATAITLDAAGATYDVRVFVPASFTGDRLPAVLSWHGLGSNGFEQLALTNYEALAESERFIVVHPTGIPDPASGRNSWELIDEQDPERDDLAFFDALVDDLVDRWCVDEQRIYSTGMSNGGFFTARLVCERAERLAAAVSVAGTTHQPDCQPARAVPYLAFHGTDDDVVPFDGSGQSSLLGTIDDPRIAEFFAQVMPDEFAEFADDFGCNTEPEVTPVSDEVTRYQYAGCDAPMSFFEITDGGHTWPGSPIGQLLQQNLGYTTPDVSATADGWAFMSQHTL